MHSGVMITLSPLAKDQTSPHLNVYTVSGKVTILTMKYHEGVMTCPSSFELYIVKQPGAVCQSIKHVTSCHQQVALWSWVNIEGSDQARTVIVWKRFAADWTMHRGVIINPSFLGQTLMPLHGHTRWHTQQIWAVEAQPLLHSTV